MPRAVGLLRQTLVSALGSDEFPCCVEILGADENLAPASEAASKLGRNVGCPVGAANFVSPQQGADHVGLALTPNDRHLYDVRHTPSLARAVNARVSANFANVVRTAGA